jgi:prepilin-type processing-associated H-X9-DG protein
LTEEKFDLLPKGTTCFLSRRILLIKAMEKFSPAVADIKNSSDDTELIRNIVKIGTVVITPKFSSTYYARTNFRETMKHAFYRGVMFADGHVLRKSKLLFKLLKFIILLLSAILIFFFTIGNLISAIFIFIFANLFLIAKFPRLKWKRLMSLNLFILPFFSSWIIGVLRGVRERNELVR